MCGFSFLYLGFTCVLAKRKLMWNDELYTYYISVLPSLADVWAALLTGGEVLPPFFYVITRSSFALLGISAVSIRVPAVLGFWLMTLCLFRFVCIRSSAPYGLLAALFPLVTSAYYYSYEARPYGLVLGFSALALLCWQSAARDRFRLLSLGGMSFSLAAAVSNHYYAILTFLPIALGEAVRTISRRRFDMPLWIALGAATTPLLLFLPLIRRAKSSSGIFWAPATWMAVPNFYDNLLGSAALPLLATLFLAGIYLTRRNGSLAARSDCTAPLWEIAAAFGFITIPVFGVLMGKFVTGAFTDRYVISAVIGFSILIALAAHRILDGHILSGSSLGLSICCWFVLTHINTFRTATGAVPSMKLLRSQSESSLPIVASDAHTFVVFSHYAPLDISERLVYLADTKAALRHLGSDSVERGMINLIKPWFHLNVTDYKSFILSQRRFYLYGSPSYLCWLIPELKMTDLRLEFRGQSGSNFLFLVYTKDQPDGAAGVRLNANPANLSDKETEGRPRS